MNGHPVPIAKANLAFKAVPLGPGVHVVRFAFRGGIRWAAIDFLVITGIAVAVASLAVLVRAWVGSIGALGRIVRPLLRPGTA